MKGKSKKKWLFNLIIGLCLLGVSLTLHAQGPAVYSAGSEGSAQGGSGAKPAVPESLYRDPERLILENEFIAVAVNNSTDATGRFGVKVTGGDPLRRGDEEKPLIFGYEMPWTSFTTIRLDGKNYIFGGKTRRRSGGTGEYGTVVSGPSWDSATNSITMTCRYGMVEVIQEISIVESTTTGYPDTTKIKYSIINRDQVSHEVGLRVVIDTMLGENDGAPFRIGETAVQTDAVFDKERLPEFWQAFDTLKDPKVIAQGTLKGREATPPDLLYFTNWGSVADYHWEPPLVPDRDFTRAGEFELDSAAVYLWQPVTIPAAGSKTYVLYYGLGGVTVVPGQLQLGVSSPAEVVYAADAEPFSVVAYIQNTGAAPAMSVRARLNLPSALRIAEGKPADIYIGKLEPGEVTQLHWKVRPTGSVFGTLAPFSVVASAINVPENKVERNIRVLKPAELTLKVSPPPGLKVVDEKLTPVPYPVTAVIKNTGESEAYGVIGSLQLGEGMQPAPKEILRRYIGNLKPGEEYKLTWYLSPEGIGKRSYLGIQFESNSTKPVMYIAGVQLPVLTPKLRLVPITPAKAGEILQVEVRVENLPMLTGVEFDLTYNPELMEIIRVSRGLFFIEDQAMAPWQPGTIDSATGVVAQIGGQRKTAALTSSTLATIHIQLSKEPGEAILAPSAVTLQSTVAKIPFYQVEGLKITINQQGGVRIDTITVDQ
ncbi:MAG TPA: cellulosome anchor protein [Firmicutes bacterium]|uniref:Cellulosome anchor protein n=1 Tax=Capillibacterium thermochitinicola TaxID=2699427 RepID=A0A8J6I0N1_9FIRM|nr:cohesin domain-containing protein [Capillibacterium thermochitinicola]MBA2132818.1 cellulosome anchor protein [Capillibacterium thermochitinicola]HHW12321.1 cellulosome anchor protein [Bacillota bacterium]